MPCSGSRSRLRCRRRPSGPSRQKLGPFFCVDQPPSSWPSPSNCGRRRYGKLSAPGKCHARMLRTWSIYPALLAQFTGSIVRQAKRREAERQISECAPCCGGVEEGPAGSLDCGESSDYAAKCMRATAFCGSQEVATFLFELLLIAVTRLDDRNNVERRRLRSTRSDLYLISSRWLDYLGKVYD